MNTTRSEAVNVAVSGVFLACGLGSSTEEVWRALCDGDSAIARRPELAGVFAARLPGVTDAPALIEHAGRAALRHAGLDPSPDGGPADLGVCLGSNTGPESLWTACRATAEGTGGAGHPARTCLDRLCTAVGSTGPKAVFATGCVAGANAVGYAYDAVAAGRAPVMLAGGFETVNTTTVATFASWKAIDPAPCAPYARSGGLSLGEAVAFLVLESEDAARARGARIHAYLRGYGLTSDAFHITAPPPDGSGLRRAMHGALGRAGLAPDAVDYVNGHGTGTPANDTAELNAMRAVFPGPRRPAMSSSKAQLGHTLGACGAVEAVLTTLAVRDGLLPPTANAGPGAAWDVVPGTARRADVSVALSNSLAFGGASCSLVLSRQAGRPRRTRAPRPVLTGAGVLSPLGVGRLALRHALLRGGGVPADVDPDALRPYISPGHLPRLDTLGALSVAAARMAWDESGLGTDPEAGARTGVVLATATGPLETVEKLNATVERDGPQYVSAVRAPNIVTSVPAGYISLELGLGGPLVAVCTGDASGLIALGHAADLIRQGQAEAVVVVAADEVTETLTRAFTCYGQLGAGTARPYARAAGPGRISAAAAAVVLESADHARARGTAVLGELIGHAVTSGPGPQAPGSAAAWSRALRRALADAPARSVDVYGAGCGVPCLDAAEADALAGLLPPDTTRLTSLAGAMGHCQSATPLLSLVAALELAGAGRLPAVPRQSDPLPAAFPYLRTGGQAGEPRTALISAASWGGTYAAALVAAHEGDR